MAYAIGMAHPMSILVETFGTDTVDHDKIVAAVRDVFDLRPAAIVRDLDLKRPIYRKTAAYGHFGRALPEFTWETVSRLDDFMRAVGLLDDLTGSCPEPIAGTSSTAAASTIIDSAADPTCACACLMTTSHIPSRCADLAWPKPCATSDVHRID